MPDGAIRTAENSQWSETSGRALSTRQIPALPSRNTSSLLSLSRRLPQLLLICLIAFTMLGAGTPSTRFDKLGHKLMCPCGCAEILLECNHVGCPDSEGMIAELHSQLGSSLADSNILAWFAHKYGSTVLASPMRGGFDLVAWIVPFAVLAAGLTGIFFLLRLWQRRHAEAVIAVPAGSVRVGTTDTMRDRIRRETTYEP